MIYGQAWSFHILLERFTGGIPSFWDFPNDLLARGQMIYWLAAMLIVVPARPVSNPAQAGHARATVLHPLPSFTPSSQ